MPVTFTRLLSLGACLLAFAMPVCAATFNVTDYGAVGDDSTDNTAALTILRNVLVTGYDTGILVREHTDADNIVVASNIHGIKFTTANHASRFGRIGTYRNTHHVTVAGRHGFLIKQMNTEQLGGGQTNAQNDWQTLVSDVNDPNNLGTGDINYWVVIGGVGAVDTFTKNGGTGIHARQIVSAP